jgi:arabinofuranosyltransferase
MVGSGNERAGWTFSDRLLAVVLVCGVVVATFVGWALFWFLTDDAFIAFRYVSNLLEGRGLVWNPAPFRPVEGYTSLLWVLVLAATWKVLGIEPPAAANWISLAVGLGTVLLVLWATWRWLDPRSSPRWRLALVSLVALGTLTNRTTLAWLSSGLETALFNGLLIGWWFLLAGPGHRPRPLAVSLLAALCALTRPDGLLVVLATGGWLLVEAGLARQPRSLLGGWPLLVVPVHLLWRHATYGSWLPNTYYAKLTGAWPEAGLRYLLSFVLEYSLWFWLFPLALLGWRQVRSGGRLRWGGLRTWLRSLTAAERAAWIAWGTLAAQLAYYTLIVGGDHFEYRVYSYLIPLVLVVGVRLGVALHGVGSRLAAYWLLAAIVASWPIPWVHWWVTRDRWDREVEMRVPIAAHFVAPVRPWVALWDHTQDWLIRHSIGIRHQEHLVFHAIGKQVLPARAEGAKLAWEQRHVVARASVGYAGWVFPHVAVIDRLGLNDWVVARTPPPPGVRKMAHSRWPPAGYVECFRPDVVLSPAGKRVEVQLQERAAKLTDQDIQACEARFAAALE